MTYYKLNCNHQGIVVVLTVATVYWFIYNRYFRPVDRAILHFMGKTFVNLNKNIQFLFPYLIRGDKKISYESRLDYWSVGHFVTYLIAGLFFPNEYSFVLIFSTLCEIFEYFAGYRGRMSDIYVNLLGYYIGSIINHKKLDEVNIKFCINKAKSLYICIPIMIILLYLLYKLRLRTNFT